jgi:hypothetical protein
MVGRLAFFQTRTARPFSTFRSISSTAPGAVSMVSPAVSRIARIMHVRTFFHAGLLAFRGHCDAGRGIWSKKAKIKIQSLARVGNLSQPNGPQRTVLGQNRPSPSEPGVLATTWFSTLNTRNK